MILNIAGHETGSFIEKGVYYFNLEAYPCMSEEELKRALAFIKYESSYGRKTEIVCGAAAVISAIEDALNGKKTVAPFILSDTTEFVYHGTGLESARKILSCGKLLSAVRVYGKTGYELAEERKDTPWNDPADFFEYIMFCNGDDMTGDYVVLSENFPEDKDFEAGNFDAAIRFYVKSSDIMRHPGNVFDGYHPTKVKDEIVLSDYMYACIVPEQFRNIIRNTVLPELADRIFYLPQRGIKLYEWNNRVSEFIAGL